MPRSRRIRISTRSSPMAVHQAEQVAAGLNRLGAETELIKLTTAGDRWMGDLAVLGGKGAFVKEIDSALLNNEADVAVHCLKDIPGDVPIPPGSTFAAYLAREDVRDAVISRTGAALSDLSPAPSSARVRSAEQRSCDCITLTSISSRCGATSTPGWLASTRAISMRSSPRCRAFDGSVSSTESPKPSPSSTCARRSVRESSCCSVATMTTR